MTMKQPINGAVIDFVSNVLGVSLPDLPYRRDLPALGLHKKRGQELLFFFQGLVIHLRCRALPGARVSLA
jgi:hypothetical protein